MSGRSSAKLVAVAAEAAARKTHCPYCAFQCGVVTSVLSATDNPGAAARLTLRPDEDFPVNRGQMCIKGFTAPALLTEPGRVTVPQLRGRDGQWTPVSWDEALGFVADRLQDVRRRRGPEATAVFGSGALTNEKAYWLGKFARLALATPHIDYNGRYCMASAAGAQNRAFGVDRGLPFPVADIAETDVLVLWGANCADTMPPLMQWINAARDRGAILVTIDPRRTETARLAQQHLALTPGSDLALAVGLLHLAITERLIDEKYIAARTVGWEATRAAALSTHPAEVERLTGIAHDEQLQLVRRLAAAPRAMVLSGRGPEQQSKGTDTALALINLMLALGKVGKPASGYGCLTGQGNGQGGREHGQKADQLAGYRSIDNDLDREAVAKVWGVPAASLPGKGLSAYELIDRCGHPDGIGALLVFGSNLLVASPNANHVSAALRNLELLVIADAFENETSALAHVLLPVTQWVEEEGTMTNLEGRVLLRQPQQPPPPGVRTDLEVIADLAQKLGAGRHFADPTAEVVFDELRAVTAGARADYAGITYPRIRREQGVFWPCPDERHAGTPRLFADRFFFPDGRARFWPVRYRPAGELPDGDYPLYFTTGRYREHYNSGAQTRRVPALVAAQPQPRVQVHPRLATRLEVEDGDRLLVESRRGAAVFVVTTSPDIRADTLFAPFHWGGRQAANALTNPALDPKSRMPEFKVCAVRARRYVEEPN